MIKEEDFGYRDKRGHFVPKEAADKNPIWIFPLNIQVMLVYLLVLESQFERLFANKMYFQLIIFYLFDEVVVISQLL